MTLQNKSLGSRTELDWLAYALCVEIYIYIKEFKTVYLQNCIRTCISKNDNISIKTLHPYFISLGVRYLKILVLTCVMKGTL